MQPANPGQLCGDYLGAYADMAMGQIINPGATADCAYCPLKNADQFLAGVAISYSNHWRDYGIGFSYIVFNIFAAVVLYYFFRVRKSSGGGGDGGGIGEKLKKVFARRKTGGTVSGETPEEKRKEGDKGPVLP